MGARDRRRDHTQEELSMTTNASLPPPTRLARWMTSRQWTIGALVVLAGLLVHAPGARASTALDAGYKDFDYPSNVGDNGDATAEKPESKLWYNDGMWWSVMWNSAAGHNRFEIYRLDTGTQDWVTTDTAVDTRQETRADTLWDGTKLYIVSHVFILNNGQPAAAGQRGQLWRYSYNAGTDTYSLDSGFPVEVNDAKSETLVIVKDSTGRLWVTWSQTDDPAAVPPVYKIKVNHSTTDDATWGTPYAIGTTNSSGLNADDVSSVIAYGGDKIGVLWSNQATGINDFFFAVHNDADADTTWTEVQPLPSSFSTDDHFHLQKLSSDSAGSIFVLAKTSTSANLIIMLRCADGTSCTSQADWSSTTVWSGSNRFTRPTMLIDTTNRDIYAFTTVEVGPRREIRYKVSDLDTISWTSAISGTQLIASATDPQAPQISDATVTKQNVTGNTDIALLASDTTTHHYFHGYLDLAGGATPTTPPTNTNVPPSATATQTPTTGPTPTATRTPTTGATPTATGSPTTGPTPTPSNTLPPTATKTNTPAATATKTNTPQGSVSTFGPVHDAQVKDSSPTSNFGTLNQFRLRSSGPAYTAYLKFDVSGVGGSIQSAKLRVFAFDGTDVAGSVYSVSNNYADNSGPWTETGLKWNNAPTIGGTALDSKGSVANNTWVEFNVLGAITGDGTYSFGLKTTSTNSVYYYSKEASNNRPQLVITLSGTPSATPLPTNTPVPTHTPVPTNTLVPTSTPPPTDTPPPTHTPTDTPVPTDGPSPTPSNTPVPTGTPSNTPAATATASLFTFVASEDTRVSSASPGSNYGNSTYTRLRAVASDDFYTYLKFNVTGLAGPATEAKVRVFAYDGSPNGGTAYVIADNTWGEMTITWTNKPVLGSALGSVGNVNNNTWAEYDVTAAITGNGTYSFALKNTSDNSMYMRAREYSSNKPELRVLGAGALVLAAAGDGQGAAGARSALESPDRWLVRALGWR